MHSLRTKITLLTTCVILIAVSVVSVLSILFIRNNERLKSEQLLLLLCETGESNLDFYFNSVQNSVEEVSSFVEDDLDGIEDEKLQAHMERVKQYFDEMVYKTNGVLTYYYRIDPEISSQVKGFWYTNLDGEGFVPHEVTDITLYDTEDTSQLIWFTVPKHDGKAIWLPPYITDNLDVRVISYNAPIFFEGKFVGVVGIEIDYSMMAEQVESIRLFSNGYAFLNDTDGNLFYHPRIDVTSLTKETMPDLPEGLMGDSTFLTYTFENVEKQAAWLPLSNGMRLTVAVPVEEMKGDWESLIRLILLVSFAVLVILSLAALFAARHIAKPLEQLAEAAEQLDEDHREFSMEYDRDDETGRLTAVLKRLTDNMKSQNNETDRQAYVDPLTSVRNKGAFSEMMDRLQNQAEDDISSVRFAIGMFDCDDLKKINDRYGLEKGDIYLKTACRVICTVFQHSPVFRIGGDEFVAVLQNKDYERQTELTEKLKKKVREINQSTENLWEQVHISMGIADFDPQVDRYVIDTIHRADKLMYEHKRAEKAEKKL